MPVHVCDPLTYYMSEFIYNLPVFEEEIEEISILQKVQRNACFHNQYNLDAHPADVHVYPIQGKKFDYNLWILAYI